MLIVVSPANSIVPLVFVSVTVPASTARAKIASLLLTTSTLPNSEKDDTVNVPVSASSASARPLLSTAPRKISPPAVVTVVES